MKNRIKKKLILIYECFYAITFNFKRWIILRTRYRLKIMSSLKTIRYIQKNHCSIARYGDGELSFALKMDHSISFQDNSEELAERLRQVLAEHNPDLLLCMPRYFNTLKGCTKKCQKYWWEWGQIGECQKNIISQLKNLVGKNYIYGDSLITRPYMDTQDIKYSRSIFDELKKIWNQKELLIVEGSQTRLGIGNDLFDNAKQIQRILAPSVNAFDKYQEIMSCIKKHYSGQLVLLALGPTATVLANDLCKIGIQAIDIGHVDIEYEWFLNRQTQKVAIAGKYTNESEQGRIVAECKDEKYKSQIIAIIEM